MVYWYKNAAVLRARVTRLAEDAESLTHYLVWLLLSPASQLRLLQLIRQDKVHPVLLRAGSASIMA